jgi:hypothetical protein
MKLGIISLSDLTADPRTGRPVAAVDRLDATLTYARAADELRLDVFTVATSCRVRRIEAKNGSRKPKAPPLRGLDEVPEEGLEPPTRGL